MIKLSENLAGTTIPCQSRPRSNVNEGVIYIFQTSRIGAFPSDGLVLYPGHFMGCASPLPQRCNQCGLILLLNRYNVDNHHHHHHHVTPSARISLTLFHHPCHGPLLLAGLKSYILYLHRAAVCRFKLVVLPWSCVGIHKSTSLISSSLLLQQCPACRVRLILIDFVMVCRWPYSC